MKIMPGKMTRLIRLLTLLPLVFVISACESKTPATEVAQPETAAGSDTHTIQPSPGIPTQLETGMVNPGYAEKPAWFANSFLDIRDDVNEAATADKRVILYFYQDGCPYCKKLLDTNFALADTVKKTRDNFEVIAINMWGDREVTDFSGEESTEKAFAQSLRVMFTPTLLFLDEQGGVVLRMNGYYPPHRFNAALDYGAQFSGSEPGFREYLAEVSPAAAAGVLHHDPSWLTDGTGLDSRGTGKPLLVMFEQKDCTPCDELHLDILKRPESREQLARFDILLLDMWSKDPVTLPDGTQTTAAKWAKILNVQYAPSMVFFDSDNREVFRTEAWLKSFHTQSSMDYVASKAYLQQPEFQRYIAARAEALEAQGIHVDIME